MRQVVSASLLALLFAVPAFAQNPPSVIDGSLTVNQNLIIKGPANLNGKTTLSAPVIVVPKLPETEPATHCALWVNNGVINRTVCP